MCLGRGEGGRTRGRGEGGRTRGRGEGGRGEEGGREGGGREGTRNSRAHKLMDDCVFPLYMYAGVVYREDTEQVLVVQDKYKVHTVRMHGFMRYDCSNCRVSPVQFVHWKFPGGLAEHAEDISKCLLTPRGCGNPLLPPSQCVNPSSLPHR